MASFASASFTASNNINMNERPSGKAKRRSNNTRNYRRQAAGPYIIQNQLRSDDHVIELAKHDVNNVEIEMGNLIYKKNGEKFQNIPAIVGILYNYWLSIHNLKNYKIQFSTYIIRLMKKYLLCSAPFQGIPNDTYKNLLRHFSFTYKKYKKDFITDLFMTGLEENGISGIIKIVGNSDDKKYLESIKLNQSIFIDNELLIKLKELNEFNPCILKYSKIIKDNDIKDADIANTIIVGLVDPKKVGVAACFKTGGTQKRRRRSKATRRLNRYKYYN